MLMASNSINHVSTSKKSIDAQKVELKIPQLTLAKIAQMGRHKTENTRNEHYSPRVEGSIPVRGNIFAQFVSFIYLIL